MFHQTQISLITEKIHAKIRKITHHSIKCISKKTKNQ